MKTFNAIAKPLRDIYDRHYRDHSFPALRFLIETTGADEILLGDIVGGLAGATVYCHLLAARSGWWDNVAPENPETFATKIALIHSEVSEALEGGRKGMPDDHLPHRSSEEVELADALIRIFDLAGARKLDLAGAVIEKLAYNQLRADHKRENRATLGGKKF